MATYYVDNTSSGSQYYFNNATSASQTHRTYTSPVISSSSHPIHISGTHSPIQQIRLDDSHHLPQQYQSVGGFNKSISQQRYQSPQSPAPQVRASVRVVGSQDQYQLPHASSQPTQISPQQHHFQFDSHHQPGHPTGPAVVYQTPGAAQYTHHNVDLWTEGPNQPSNQPSNQDHYVQAQRVSVRSVSTGSPHHSHSVSPQRPQDHLQQYYSQLTPEQHQQLLRQQQLPREQEQTSHYDQQHQQRVTVQQVSPSSTYQHEQHRSTAGFATGGPQHQQVRGRSDSERHRQDEQDYFTAQRHMTAQRAPQHEEESQPVGIRNLMSKFGGNAPVQNVHPRSKSSNASRQYSTSSYTTNSGPNQRSTTRTVTTQSMTYSALPKSYEPPVNSVEYYQMQMQQQSCMPFTNIQQAAAPAHIQHAPPTPTGFNAVRDRFKTGSMSEDYYRQAPMSPQYHPPPQQQQQQQQQQFNAGGSSLSSLRNQYMTRAKEVTQNELPEQPVQPISRTIVGEDIPKPKQQQQQQPVSQPPQQQQQQQPQQQPAPASAPPPQPEPAPEPSQEANVEQQAPALEEAASPPTAETTTTAAAAAGSS